MTPRLPDADRRCPSAGQTRGLPVPVQRASAHAQGLRPRRTGRALALSRSPCCLPLFRPRRRPEISSFRGSMAGLCAPLSTLRRHPRGYRRMTRGQCGSLDLHCKRLALSTPCRSSRRTENLDLCTFPWAVVASHRLCEAAYMWKLSMRGEKVREWTELGRGNERQVELALHGGVGARPIRELH